MKPWLTACFLLAFWPMVASAQVTMNLGGTGAYGPLNVTATTTIQLPPDGVIQATTVNISPGVTLTFGKNARNTGAMIVATGDVVIDGIIDVSGGQGVVGAAGAGGPGGGAGGVPVLNNADSSYVAEWLPNLSNDGTLVRAVGNAGGNGSYAYNAPTCYSLGAGGGGGGGALYVFSNTKISSTQLGAGINIAGGVASPVMPSGGNSCYYKTPAVNGSDGVVRLVAPTISAATLSINVLIAGTIRIQRLPASGGLPTTMNANYQAVVMTTSQNIDAFISSPLTVSILSVDGTATPGTDTWNYFYAAGATSTTIVSNVSGCQTGKTLSISMQSQGFVSGCTPDRTTFPGPGIANATQNWTCTLAASPSTGRVFASATCQ